MMNVPFDRVIRRGRYVSVKESPVTTMASSLTVIASTSVDWHLDAESASEHAQTRAKSTLVRSKRR